MLTYGRSIYLDRVLPLSSSPGGTALAVYHRQLRGFQEICPNEKEMHFDAHFVSEIVKCLEHLAE